jgi:hypothetical protein
MCFQADAGNSEGAKVRPDFDHPQAFAKSNHVDGKQHAKSMNAGGRADQKPAPGIEPLLSYEPD